MQHNSAKRKPRLIDRWRAMPVPRRIAILVLSSFAFLYIFGRYYTNISESIQRNRDPYYRDAEEFLSLFNDQIAHADMALVYDKNTKWDVTQQFARSVTLPVGGASVPTVCVLTAEKPSMDIESIEFIQTLPAGASAGNELYMFSQVILHIFSERDLVWAIQQEIRGNPQRMRYCKTFRELRETLLGQSASTNAKEYCWEISSGSQSGGSTDIIVSDYPLSNGVKESHLRFQFVV